MSKGEPWTRKMKPVQEDLEVAIDILAERGFGVAAEVLRAHARTEVRAQRRTHYLPKDKPWRMTGRTACRRYGGIRTDDPGRVTCLFCLASAEWLLDVAETKNADSDPGREKRQ